MKHGNICAAILALLACDAAFAARSLLQTSRFPNIPFVLIFTTSLAFLRMLPSTWSMQLLEASLAHSKER